MECYQCLQDNVTREADHIVMEEEPPIIRRSLAPATIPSKKARLILCRTCKEAVDPLEAEPATVVDICCKSSCHRRWCGMQGRQNDLNFDRSVSALSSPQSPPRRLATLRVPNKQRSAKVDSGTTLQYLRDGAGTSFPESPKNAFGAPKI